MIEATNLSKQYGRRMAVQDLTFSVRPGVVTGFLGANGAGKSTTMRLMLGLDHGGGTTLFDGRRFADLDDPGRQVGAVLEARAFHPGRTARNHLLMLADGLGLPARRVDEVLTLVDLQDVAGRRAGGFSLGMGQRLSLATALLGDPEYLILDEPANGLDPVGVHWLRALLHGFAAEGRTVFVSSHLLAEMQALATELVVIDRGRLLVQDTMAGFMDGYDSLEAAFLAVAGSSHGAPEVAA